MRKNNKSQLILLAGFLLLSLAFFIYSLETDNSYKLGFQNTNIVDNIIYETCQVGYRSNNLTIDARYSDFSSQVASYCGQMGYQCVLDITMTGSAPLNYTDYDYELDFQGDGYSVTKGFSC